MFLCDLALLGPDKVAVTHDFFAVDVEAIDPVWPREDEPGDEIVGTAELEPVRPPNGQVRTFAGRELPDVVAAEHCRAASRAEPQGLARSHSFRPATGARDEQRLLDLHEEIAALVRGRPVYAEPDSHLRFEQVAHACDAGSQSHVRGGTVRDPHALSAEGCDVIVREVH